MNKEKAALIHKKIIELEKKISGIKKISGMVKGNIDRKFHLNIDELTPSELDFEMGRRVLNLRGNIDPRNYINLKNGRGKITKIIMLLPFLLRMIFIKPVSIIRDLIFLGNAMMVRMRKTDSRLSELENKLSSTIVSSEFNNKL